MLFSLLFLLASLPVSGEHWGFFAHRHINRMAVYTLPPAMMPLFKTNIDYLAEHAVDPDKRRYAVEHEAVRHYIDLDHWGSLPFDSLPRTRLGTLVRYGELTLYRSETDSLRLVGPDLVRPASPDSFLRVGERAYRSRSAYRAFFVAFLLPHFYGDAPLPCDTLRAFFRLEGPCGELDFRDEFAAHGILPFHLLRTQQELTEALRRRDHDRALKLAAEQGHYLSDAHVPLHTTENYNGQLTGQEGIHAFWESRIPELFAEAEFDFLVGKARYIDDLRDYFWSVVLESHRLSHRVLRDHREVRDSIAPDRQWCFEPRGDRVVRQPCREYAQAYRQRMAGMVERRMRASVHAVGSAWYTAWVDAGQPPMGLGARRGAEAALLELDSLYRLDRFAPASRRPHE